MSDGVRPVELSDDRGGPAGQETPVVDTARLRAVSTAALEAMSVPRQMELSVILVDPERMTELNSAHMGADRPTDVLAFPLDTVEEATADRPSILGDVVLCPAVAAEQAGQNRTSTQAEMEMLTVHGILHLLGYDHAEPKEKAEMFGLTDTLLAAFNAAGTAVVP